MRIPVQKVKHGKEDDRIDDKADDHTGGPLQAGSGEKKSGERICDNECAKDAQKDSDHLSYGPRFHTSTVSVIVLRTLPLLAGEDRNC